MDTQLIPICHRKLVTVVDSLTFIVFTTECLGMELSLSTAQPYLPTSLRESHCLLHNTFLGESHCLLHNTSLRESHCLLHNTSLPQGESLSTAQPYLPTSLGESHCLLHNTSLGESHCLLHNHTYPPPSGRVSSGLSTVSMASQILPGTGMATISVYNNSGL